MDNRVEIIMMEMEETPVCDAGATEKCLFCAVSLPPSFTIANGKITRLKRETADHDDCLSNPGSLLSTEDSVLDKHLEVVFILRKILDIPERKLHQFLKQFGGQLHPEFWVGVCALCGEAVQQFYTALKEISELKKRLTRISKQLKGRIYDTREVGGAENGLTCIWEEIRGEVLKDYQEVPFRVVDVLKRDPEETSQPQDADSEGCGNINSRKVLPSRCLSKGPRSYSRLSSYSEPNEEVDNDEKPISDFEPDDHDSNGSNHSTDSEIVKQEPTKMQRRRGPYAKPEPFITIIRHGNKTKFKCSLCSAVRCDRISLRTHLRSHQRRDGFSCTECGWLIHSRDKNRHYTRHHPGKKPPAYIFSCQKCPARYPRKACLMKHAELHENSGNSEPCSLCGWLVKIKSMPSHMKIHHHQQDKSKEKHSHSTSQVHEAPLDKSMLTKQKTAHQTKHSGIRNFENLEPNLFTLSPCESTERLSTGNSSPNCELPGKEDATGNDSTSDFKPDSDDDSSSSSTHSQDSEDEEYKPSPRKRILKRQSNSLCDPQTIRKRGRPPKPKESSNQLKSSRKKKTRRVSEVSDPAYQSLYTSFREDGYTMFKCNLCSAVRHNRDRMIAHLKYHEKGEGSLCPECGWLVPPGRMSHHIARIHAFPVSKKKAGQPKNEKRYHSYKCPICPARSTEKSVLDRHLLLHDPSNEEPCTTCELCGWLLKTTSLQRHLASSLCAIIVEEQKQDDGEIAYSCDHCQMLYTEKWVLKKHFRIYHADQEEWKVCGQPNCQEKFESKQLLKFHMDMAHPDVQNLEENPESEEGDSKCPHCELIFASKIDQDYHIAKKHKSMLLTCTTCNITMKNYMCYRKHMEQTSIHATSRSVFCELCGASFWSDTQLRLHKRHQHFAELGLVPIKCQECGLSLCTNVALKHHINAIHAKEKNYSCEYCGQTFLRQGTFAAHMRAFHEGPLATPGATDGKHFRLEKKGKDGVETWLCDFCPGTATFANLMAVRSHLLKVHYSELTYICEGCNKRFCASLGLHKHRKRCEDLKKKNEEELNGKTYPCRFCPKHFFAPTSLAKHERSLHKDRHSNLCQKCGKAFKTFGMLTTHRKKCVLVPPSETATE